jgi:hypothetical protein
MSPAPPPFSLPAEHAIFKINVRHARALAAMRSVYYQLFDISPAFLWSVIAFYGLLMKL